MKIVLGVIGASLVLLMWFVGSIAFAHGGKSDLIHTCVNKKTKLLRRIKPHKTCRDDEKPLDWNSSSWSAYVVYDSNNKRVGEVTEFAGGVDPIVTLGAGERYFQVRVLPDRFEDPLRPGDASIHDPHLFFESDDCTGTAYLQLLNPALLQAALVVPSQNAVYVQTEGSQPVSRLTSSNWHPKDERCRSDDWNTLTVPAERIDLTAEFTPPYHLEINSKITNVGP